MKIDDLLGYPCFWKPPYVYVRAGPGKIFCGSVPENHQSISQLWPVPRIDSYHSYRRISIHWHLKIPTSQAGAVILRVHQVKERLCHSTPSGGYGIARGASSPVSMAGETVAALGVLETKRCNCGDRWGEMQQSALPHQQVISVIWEFDGNHLLSSWSDSIWISSHVKSKQPGNELLVLRQKWDEVRAAMLTQVLPERYILKFMKQTFPISFQRDQFQLKKKKLQWSKQPEFVASLNWLDALPPPVNVHCDILFETSQKRTQKANVCANIYVPILSYSESGSNKCMSILQVFPFTFHSLEGLQRQGGYMWLCRIEVIGKPCICLFVQFSKSFTCSRLKLVNTFIHIPIVWNDQNPQCR